MITYYTKEIILFIGYNQCNIHSLIEKKFMLSLRDSNYCFRNSVRMDHRVKQIAIEIAFQGYKFELHEKVTALSERQAKCIL